MDIIERIFKCTRCGFCCQGTTTVSLSEDDRKRMGKALGLSQQELEERFLKITASVVQMKTEDGHCVFYNNGCLVHEGRPWRCAQWPLVPALLNGEDNFHIISESCPGINKHISYSDFCALLKEHYHLHDTVIC
ncbi:MAG: YkgJ family cysteine cluster protein [Desulfocapsaceae bacterium]|nr:YkgJ family cysteine cluster protein [Desulfocapsaceae bacterium]